MKLFRGLLKGDKAASAHELVLQVNEFALERGDFLELDL